MSQPSRTPEILHDAGDWFVLDKPAGWHTVRGATAGDEVIETWLAATMPAQTQLEECGLVHRLDRDTSGCLVVARSPEVATRLRESFRGSAVRKLYLALARSAPREPLETSGACTLYFSSRHKGSAKATVRESGDAREVGRLAWRVLSRCAAGDLVEIELLGPGRRHQIRAGLAYLGAPLVGDALYGGGEGRPHLHAWVVELEGTRVEAPQPSWASVNP